MTDAEIFKRNVMRICKQKHMKIGRVDLEAGYSEKYISQMAYKGNSITVEHIRNYARVLGVKPERLTIGMFDGDISEIFKHNIQILCEEKRVSMAHIMREAGYNENHLYHLACKHIAPTDEAIRCYAEALGVKQERLLEGFDDY